MPLTRIHYSILLQVGGSLVAWDQALAGDPQQSAYLKTWPLRKPHITPGSLRLVCQRGYGGRTRNGRQQAAVGSFSFFTRPWENHAGPKMAGACRPKLVPPAHRPLDTLGERHLRRDTCAEKTFHDKFALATIGVTVSLQLPIHFALTSRSVIFPI